jgi:autotransporter-associated beta strand protein
VASGLTATVAIPVGEDTTGRELIKVGTGTLVVSGNLAHTGATSVAQGTLVLSGVDNSAATGGMTLNGGVTQFNSPASINGTGNNVTVNAGGTVVFGSSFGTATDITTALASRIVASSVGTIAADNQDTTAFDFNTGGLTAAYLGAVGNVSYTGTPLTPNGTTYRLGGGGGTLTMANANTVTGTGNSLIVNGKVTLAAANDYDTGTTLTAGVLTLGDDNSIGAGPLTLNGGTIDAANGARTLTTNNAVTIGGNFTFGGSNALNLGTGAVTNAGNRGITLSGTNSTLTMGVMTNTSSAAQTTTVNGTGNTLVLGGYALSDNATPRIDVINGTGNVTISGPVTNGGTATASGLTYSGTGVLTLSGSNSYTGVTTVTAGTVAIPSVADAGNASPLGAYATAGAAGISLGGQWCHQPRLHHHWQRQH